MEQSNELLGAGCSGSITKKKTEKPYYWTKSSITFSKIDVFTMTLDEIEDWIEEDSKKPVTSYNCSFINLLTKKKKKKNRKQKNCCPKQMLWCGIIVWMLPIHNWKDHLQQVILILLFFATFSKQRFRNYTQLKWKHGMIKYVSKTIVIIHHHSCRYCFFRAFSNLIRMCWFACVIPTTKSPDFNQWHALIGKNIGADIK